MRPPNARVFFSSTDCSGTPLMELIETSDPVILPKVFHDPATGATYLPRVSGGSQVTVQSRLFPGLDEVICVTAEKTATFAPAIRVPQIESFTPPFEVVTRGDLLAE